jgi:hypothetical protein
MAVKENSKGLLSKVASLIRKDDKDASENNQSKLDRGTDTTQESLKARVEQKRRDDIIRRREFDYLRKIRSNGIVTSSYVAGKSQVFQSSGGYQGQERENTVKKINDIEAQMSRNWWARKQEDSHAHAGQVRAPQPMPPKPPPKPVIASVRMGLDDPAPGKDLLEGFEFATSQEATPLRPAVVPNADTRAPSAKAPTSDPVVIGFVPSVSGALESGISGFSNSKLISIEMGTTLGDPALQEASIRFAEGDTQGALVLLESGYESTDARLDTAQIYAGALFDLHRATGAKDAFDKFALQYAERFGTSPPEWCNLPDIVREKRAKGAKNAVELRSDEWACPATLDLKAIETLKNLAQRTSGTVHVHWAALLNCAEGVATAFADLLADWAGKPMFKLSFSGVPTLLRVIKQYTPGGDVRTSQEWWRLRLNALRVLDLPDEFDQVALDFCMVYELSPPSWEPPKCVCVHEMVVTESTPDYQVSVFDAPGQSVFGLLSASDSAVAELDGEVVGDADESLAVLRDGIKGSGQLVVSCSHLIRVDFAAAGSILNWVANLESLGCYVQFQDVSRLVAAFFNVIGINDHASVVLRSR